MLLLFHMTHILYLEFYLMDNFDHFDKKNILNTSLYNQSFSLNIYRDLSEENRS